MLATDNTLRSELIRFFIEEFQATINAFEKIDTAKLNFIRTYYLEILEAELVTLDELLMQPTQVLILLSNENLLELIQDELVAFAELTSCSPQELEILLDYEIRLPIVENNLTVRQLLDLYNENPKHLEYLTCDDLYDAVLEMAPNVDPLLMHYAEEQNVDLEDVMDALCESDQMLFRINLGWDDEDPVSDDEQCFGDEEELSHTEASETGSDRNDDSTDDETVFRIR